MIYLDNAATSFPKPHRVISALNECLRAYCGNPGRSSHRLSLRAAEKIYEVRELVSDFIGGESPESVVFTPNATHSLNLAIKTYISGPCHVLCSDIEHNSVIRPLEKLGRTLGVEYSRFDSKSPRESIKSLIRPDTVGIISTVASNVAGIQIDAAELSVLAKENNLFLILDASQALGHLNVNLKATPCDVLCGPGHKGLFGIQGSGFAYFKDTVRKESYIEGGSGSESINVNMPTRLPEAYEAGTLSTPAIVSLGEGIKYLSEIGLDKVKERLDYLSYILSERLLRLPEISLLPAGNGIVSFTHKSYPSSYIVGELDKYGVCARGGLHCAPDAHKKLGTIDGGAVRLSFSYLNGERDILGALAAISRII